MARSDLKKAILSFRLRLANFSERFALSSVCLNRRLIVIEECSLALPGRPTVAREEPLAALDFATLNVARAACEDSLREL
jgi:hypothetical protein